MPQSPRPAARRDDESSSGTPFGKDEGGRLKDEERARKNQEQALFSLTQHISKRAGLDPGMCPAYILGRSAAYLFWTATSPTDRPPCVCLSAVTVRAEVRRGCGRSRRRGGGRARGGSHARDPLRLPPRRLGRPGCPGSAGL